MIDFTAPKLLEVTMTSGTFVVGETVVGTMSRAESNLTPTPDESTPTFKFRLAEPNHKTGPYDDPATCLLYTSDAADE